MNCWRNLSRTKRVLLISLLATVFVAGVTVLIVLLAKGKASPSSSAPNGSSGTQPGQVSGLGASGVNGQQSPNNAIGQKLTPEQAELTVQGIVNEYVKQGITVSKDDANELKEAFISGDQEAMAAAWVKMATREIELE